MGFGLNTIKHADRRWPKTITYGRGNMDLNANIALGLKAWQKSLNNGITFTPSIKDDLFKIEVVDGIGGAWTSGDSLNGRKPNSKNGILKIGKNATLGTIIHEIGHLLGLSHEQNRPDSPKEWRKNLLFADEVAAEAQNHYTSYGSFDTSSIMLYQSGYENKNNPSAGDISAVKAIYGI